MIEIPQEGFKRSVNQSNVKPNPLGDWLEAIVLFDQNEVTKSDVVDILIEYEICPDKAQDLAHDIASAGWDELRRRKSWGGIPDSLDISEHRIEDSTDWKDSPIRSFLLLLSMFKLFPDWGNDNRENIVQGNLFEEVVEKICPALLPGWEVYRAGWTPDNARDIHLIVDDLCERLNTRGGAANIDQWLPLNARDAGLDLVCYRSFSDHREAIPVCLLQCASGKNWRGKVDTPNADKWQKLLDSAVKPSTGIVVPFVIEDKDLSQAALTGQKIIFDRLRLLNSVLAENIRLPEDLSERLINWIRPRIETLPKAV